MFEQRLAALEGAECCISTASGMSAILSCVMGLCKAALESATEYVASELGRDGIRVNALSAGPVRTISASGVGDFKKMLKLYDTFSPLRRNITEEEVGKAGMFLLSDLASGITGENMIVDQGHMNSRAAGSFGA